MSRAVAGAIAVHVLMLALIVVGTMDWKPFRQPEQVAIAIEAVPGGRTSRGRAAFLRRGRARRAMLLSPGMLPRAGMRFG